MVLRHASLSLFSVADLTENEPNIIREEGNCVTTV